MTPEELDKLEALVKAATPGPWRDEREPFPVRNLWFERHDGAPIESRGTPFGLGVAVGVTAEPRDAAAIAALHNAAPALIAAARDLHALQSGVGHPMWLPSVADALSMDDPFAATSDDVLDRVRSLAREVERLRATVDTQTAIIVDLKVEKASLELDVERLRAFVPVWKRAMGAWELHACGVRVGWVEWVGHDYVARIDVGRGGWKSVGTHPDLPTAARAVCARLGIPSVEVPDP